MDFQERLYNYETPPPEDAWRKINSELNFQSGKVVPITTKKNTSRKYLYIFSAAASIIIILLGAFLFNKHSAKPMDQSLTASQTNVTNKKIQDSIYANNKILNEIITSTDDKNFLALNYEYSLRGRKYLTVSGPDGSPVKISPKAALLIESADNEFPPKPVWNKKIDKWQQIMLSSTLSPTSASLLDVLQMPANDE